MNLTVAVTYEQDGDGWYGYSPDLPGCQSQGKSREEIEANMREAIEGYLETLSPVEIALLEHRRVETQLLEVVV
jgi:predicted RNase H-like HicB family nuclease